MSADVPSTDGSSQSGVSRRTALRTLGFGAAAVVLAGSGLLTSAAAWARRGPLEVDTPSLTLDQWAATRGATYYAAHRGSGDVYPEHSMEAYQAAFDWGAQCLEISVGMTSDGVLICLHDLTYDRTTTASGPVYEQPSSVLQTARIWQPRLGRAWIVNPPRIPLFEDVLRAFGGQVILAVEAKLDAAYEPMMAMVERYQLRDSVIVKAHYASTRWAQAKAAGYPVFCYFGAAQEAVPDTIEQTAAKLDPQRDYLVIPAFDAAGAFLDDAIVSTAVRTGVPVWVFPVHRRSDARHFFDRGALGAVCASYGYIAGAVTPVTTDNWAGQAVAAGQMTLDPAADADAAQFTSTGELVLAAAGMQHFVTLGQLGPMPETGGYSIAVDAGWRTLPASLTDNLTIAFDRADDSYYEHRQGDGDGYHAILRANGSMALYRHRDGEDDGELLAPAVQTPALPVGRLAPLRLDVSATAIVLSRTDCAARVSVAGTAAPGGYVHIGRSSEDGVALFRSLRVS